MITVITGVPGSGKTLYAIEKLIRPLLGTHINLTTDDGLQVQVPRTIYTNISGFQCDHELIQADTDEGLHNWQAWAKPGSVIVFDEFQRAWPPRPNGSKVPPDLAALDTHRHMGVDFILMTQNVMNCDRHLHGLCGRHLHVRRFGNLSVCMVYEWDHCSRSLQFKNAMARKAWRYDKSVFLLYKSAQVHTKQPRSLPYALYVIPVVLAVLAYFGPIQYKKLTTPRVSPALAAASAPLVAVAPRPIQGGLTPVKPVAALGQNVDTPARELVGVRAKAPMCIVSAAACICYAAGALLKLSDGECRTTVARSGAYMLFPPLAVDAEAAYSEPVRSTDKQSADMVLSTRS